eukprot:1500347-Pleurochrysis_carterae.AAC.1
MQRAILPFSVNTASDLRPEGVLLALGTSPALHEGRASVSIRHAHGMDAGTQAATCACTCDHMRVCRLAKACVFAWARICTCVHAYVQACVRDNAFPNAHADTCKVGTGDSRSVHAAVRRKHDR